MYRSLLVLILVIAVGGPVAAQEDEWQSAAGDVRAFNCKTVSALQSAIAGTGTLSFDEIGDSLFVRDINGETKTVTEYLGTFILTTSLSGGTLEFTLVSMLTPAYEACSEPETQLAADGDAFVVVANSNVNLRDCAGTDCAVVGQTTDGQMLTVVGQTDDWYEVQTADGTAYIASWLTTRGPDAVISTTEGYEDENTGCYIVFDIKRGDMDINLILAGTKQSDIYVDLYRPNENRPLTVEGQFDKTFIDTNEPYIHQYYNWNVGWPQGNYQLEIMLNGATSRLSWELETRGDYNIYVICD